MSDRSKDEAKSSNPTQGKKPYRAPALIQWGSLRDITLSGGKTAKHTDGGSSKGNKQTS